MTTKAILVLECGEDVGEAPGQPGGEVAMYVSAPHIGDTYIHTIHM